MTFDVALDGAMVVMFKATPGHPSGLPLTGDAFILFGTIFPAGTFDAGDLNPDQIGAIGRSNALGLLRDRSSDRAMTFPTRCRRLPREGLPSSTGCLRIGPVHHATIHDGFSGLADPGTPAIVGGNGNDAGAGGDSRSFRSTRWRTTTPSSRY